jgi:hypothetical protein
MNKRLDIGLGHHSIPSLLAYGHKSFAAPI